MRNQEDISTVLPYRPASTSNSNVSPGNHAMHFSTDGQLPLQQQAEQEINTFKWITVRQRNRREHISGNLHTNNYR